MTMFMYLQDVLISVLFPVFSFHLWLVSQSKLILWILLWIPAGGAAWMSAQYTAEKHADAKRARKTPWLLYVSDEGWHTAKAMILLYPSLHWNHTEMYEVDILWTDGRTDSTKVLVWWSALRMRTPIDMIDICVAYVRNMCTQWPCACIFTGCAHFCSFFLFPVFFSLGLWLVSQKQIDPVNPSGRCRVNVCAKTRVNTRWRKTRAENSMVLYASDKGWHTAKAMISLYAVLHWNHTEMYEVDILWTDGQTDRLRESISMICFANSEIKTLFKR